jgi:hypothetical protein
MVDFWYLNLEPLLNIIAIALFFAVIASRVAAGDECSTYWLNVETNAIAVSVLQTLSLAGLFGLQTARF